VNCRQAEQHIAAFASGRPIPAEAAAHIAGCEHCRKLAAAMGAPDGLVPPDAEQLQRIKAQMLRNLKPVTVIPRAGVIFALLIAISLAAAAIGAWKLGIAGLQARDAIQRIAVFTSLAAGLILLATSLGREIAPGSRVVFPPAQSIAALLAIFAGVFAFLFEVRAEPAFVATGLVCLRIGLEFALAVAAVSWLVLRRGVSLDPVRAGALCGALAGLSGLAVLEIFCPNLNRYHVMTWHLGAAVVSVAAGAFAGWIARRYSPSSAR
jgi:hypothetical protein